MTGIKRDKRMNYKASKIFTILFCSIFMVIGGGAILGVLFANFDLFFLLWGGMFFFIGLGVMTSRLKQLSTFQKMTYEWYKSSYPDAFSKNRVSCYSCGNSRIHVRALLNKTYHREHFCTQCGRTLYYSREQN